MNDCKSTNLSKILVTVLLILSFTLCSVSCSLSGSKGRGRIMNSSPSKPETQSTEVTVVSSETAEPTPVQTTETTETTEITGTTETGETSETSGTSESTTESRLTYEEVSQAYIYSVWYDAVDSNPADYDEIDSNDAFALKGVFYFNKPLTAVFEANLYKGDELVMTREVRLRENVTAEADFSAGLAGLGTFAPGDYTVELLYEGENIAVTPSMRVR